MRFLLKLNPTGNRSALPIDYQYYTGAWIYKVIGKADTGFARFLHSEGYRDGHKSFKLFNYSPLLFEKYRILKKRALIEIIPGTTLLHVSFCLNEAAEKFIIGLFNNQQFYLGDKFNGIDFTVSQVERLPDPFQGDESGDCTQDSEGGSINMSACAAPDSVWDGKRRD